MHTKKYFLVIFFIFYSAALIGSRVRSAHADSVIGYSEPNYDTASGTPVGSSFRFSGASSTFIVDGNSRLYTAAWIEDTQGNGPCVPGGYRFYLSAGAADTNWFYGQQCDGPWYGDNNSHWTKYDYLGPGPCGPPYAWCGSAPPGFGNGEQLQGSAPQYTIDGSSYASVIFADASSTYDPNICIPAYPHLNDCQIVPTATSPGVENVIVTGTSITVQATPLSSSTDPLELQFEAEPVGIGFTNDPTATSTPVSSGQLASATLEGLANGGYHLQVRAVDTIAGTLGVWQSFGLASSTDFTVVRALTIESSSILEDPLAAFSAGNSSAGGCCSNSAMSPARFFYQAPAPFVLSQLQADTGDVSSNNHDGVGNIRAWIYDMAGTPVASSTNTIYGENSCAGCSFAFENVNIPQDFQLGLVVEDGLQGDGGFTLGNIRFNGPAKTVNAKEPVLIVPGIMGTSLVRASDHQEVWPYVAAMLLPGEDHYLDDLALGTSGRELAGKNMNASSVIEEELGAAFYKNLLDGFRNAGYVDGTDLFTAPYDWRLGMATQLSALRAKILEAASSSPDGKINIIAHSLGGLLVKDYLANATDTSFLDKLVLVGVPQLGTPEAFKLLNYGDSLVPFGPVDILNPQEVKKISENMPSVYELLPSGKYITVAGGYVQDFRNGGDKILSSADTASFMTSNASDTRNPALLRSADMLHASLDPRAVHAGDVYNIVGCLMPTTSGFDLYDGNVVEIMRNSGDGIVPEVSAMNLANNFHNYFVLGSETGIDHAGLVADARPVGLITDIITGATSTSPLPQGISTSTSDCVTPRTSVVPGETTIAFSTHSPVALNVYDPAGRHVGPLPNGDVDLGIAGATYETIGENSFVTVPASGTYKVIMQALSAGNFTFQVRGYKGSILDRSASYLAVPLHGTSTKAELDFSGFDNNMGLKADNVTYQPGAILSTASSGDVMPPVISIRSPLAIDYLSGKSLPVTVALADAGSGIGFREISMDGIPTTSLAIDTSALSLGTHTLSVRAIDKAGNPSISQVHFNVVATLDTTSSDVDHCFDKGSITRKDIRDQIAARLKNMVTIVRGKKNVDAVAARTLLAELRMWHNKDIIDDKAWGLLRADIQWLIKHGAG